MNAPRKFLQSTAAAIVVSVGFTSCENLGPGASSALKGLGAGLIAGGATGFGAHALGMDKRKAALLGAGVGAVTAVVVYVIAKRQATERQRQIAEQRAEAVSRKIASGKVKPKTRYVAVKTVSSPESKGATDVMLFDTQTNQVVGNSVYDLKEEPSSGEVVKFDTHTAEYVSN
jgi:hypothetical protein